MDKDTKEGIENSSVTSYDTPVTANTSELTLLASSNKLNFNKENWRIDYITLDALNKETQVVMSKDEPKICTAEVKVKTVSRTYIAI